MSRKKKDKVIKLSEEDYNKYIMSLKGSRPPLPIKKAMKDEKSD